MWLYFVAGCISLVIFIVLFNAWLGWLGWYRGSSCLLSNIGGAISCVMEGGLNKSVVRIHDVNSGCWVDFRKSIKKGNPTRFTLVFEPKKCHKPELELIEIELRRIELKYTIHNQSRSSRCLTVECGRDLQKAVQSCRAVFNDTMKLPLDHGIVIKMRGHIDLRHRASHGW